MTIVQIFINAYLIVGGLAATFIWAALIASKRRGSKTGKIYRERLAYGLFRRRDTKPSRFHS